MANPTTNFGWVMPTSASLVTNLPADFNVFGQAVDTSMQYLLGGTTGQVLSKTSGTNMAFTWTTPTDQTPLTTKGDLFTFSTVDARLAVGTNKYVLGADSTQSTGLAWQTSPQSIMTTTGDTLYASAANTPARLGIGSTGQVLTVASGIPSWATPTSTTPAFVGCSLKFGANQTLSNATNTLVAFDQEHFDTNAFHDNSTNNSRITIPASYAGKYLITANISTTAWNNDSRVSIYKNGSTIAASFLRWSAPDLTSANVYFIADLAVSDYLQINMFQSSGSSQTLKGQNDLGAGSSFFQVQFLGA